MPSFTREDFLKQILKTPNPSTQTNKYNVNKDPFVIKYGNKSLPISSKKSRSTLAPYAGVWGEKQKIHFLRRTMYGVKKAHFNTINSMTLTQAVNAILNTTNPAPMQPINFYQNSFADLQSIPLGQTWVNTAYNGDGTLNYYRYLSVRTAWMHNILNQPFSIEEKMLMFWHNHFVTQYSSIGEARLMHEYLNLLRTHALGNFKTFVKEVTKNGMMLYYLNGAWNNKWAPDENYARELQELFTLGTGPNMWTEDDVKKAARVLTGFRMDVTNSYTYFYDGTWHDEGNKQFSPFYGGTTIQGQLGNAGEGELDHLINMIFSKETILAKFICRKIYRYFMHYDIDNDIETNIISGLAQTFINSNWNIKPVLSQLFSSDHFFDPLTMDAVIKNPVDFYLGFYNTARVELPLPTQYEEYHMSLTTVGYVLDTLAMSPGDPPNVAGWTAYHQTPHYHQLWINSDSIPKRMSYVDNLVNPWGQWLTANTTVYSNIIEFAKDCPTPSDPDILIDFFISRLLSFSFTTATKNLFKSILLSGQSSNYYWTNAWNAYMANPSDPVNLGVVKSRLHSLLTVLCRTAEHQIA